MVCCQLVLHAAKAYIVGMLQSGMRHTIRGVVSAEDASALGCQGPTETIIADPGAGWKRMETPLQQRTQAWACNQHFCSVFLPDQCKSCSPIHDLGVLGMC